MVLTQFAILRKNKKEDEMNIYENAKLDTLIKLDFNESWYLSGGIGTGKTHNAYAYYLETNKKTKEIKLENEAKFIFKNYDWIVFYNFATLCDELRNTQFESFNGIEKSRTEKEEAIIKTKYLILDDLGSEKRSDYSDDFLIRLVEFRYSNDLYTGFTSNISIGKLPYDARIVSRIAGIVSDNKFCITGKDRRIK